MDRHTHDSHRPLEESFDSVQSYPPREDRWLPPVCQWVNDFVWLLTPIFIRVLPSTSIKIRRCNSNRVSNGSASLAVIARSEKRALRLLVYEQERKIRLRSHHRLAYYGCGFDSRTVQTFVCMNMSVCIGSGCFYV
jgi:hypothetical protein